MGAVDGFRGAEDGVLELKVDIGRGMGLVDFPPHPTPTTLRQYYGNQLTLPLKVHDAFTTRQSVN